VANGSIRILVAHQALQTRNGDLSQVMGFIHDQVVNGVDCVYYFCFEEIPAHFSGRMFLLMFPLLIYRHAVSDALSVRPYDLIHFHKPNAALISAHRSVAA
jgi:hypothetical protein